MIANIWWGIFSKLLWYAASSVVIFLSFLILVYLVVSWDEQAAIKRQDEEKKRLKENLSKYIYGNSYDEKYYGPRICVRLEGEHFGEKRQFCHDLLCSNGAQNMIDIQTLNMEYPAIGPPMDISRGGKWNTNPVASYTVYVVEIYLPLGEGGIDLIHKAGITSKKCVIGEGGRYESDEFVRRVIVEINDLSVDEAWDMESKLHYVLDPAPTVMSRKEFWEQLKSPFDIPSMRSMELNYSKYRESLEMTDEELERLGPTEWRTWRFDDDELIKLVMGIASHSFNQSE